MSETFRRPDLFVPLSVRFITGNTGTKLLEKFGRDGPLVWIALLAACKANRPPGELIWASEPEVWNKLGLTGYEPDFTFKEFLAFTGRLKLTRRTDAARRRSGRCTHVAITVWGRWTNVAQTEQARERKSRSRAHSERDSDVTGAGHSAGPERDLEQEQEKERENSKATRARGTNEPRNGLPITLERLILTTNASDRSAAAIRKHAQGLPEASIARVLESLQTRTPKPNNPGGYVVAALKAEHDELLAVRAKARASLERVYPDEPDTE